MKELDYISAGLVGCNTMLMKVSGEALECSFIKKGLVANVVLVNDQVLAHALAHLGNKKILEGPDLQQFKATFNNFSLRVRARKLFLDLRFTLKKIDCCQEEVVAA